MMDINVVSHLPRYLLLSLANKKSEDAFQERGSLQSRIPKTLSNTRRCKARQKPKQKGIASLHTSTPFPPTFSSCQHRINQAPTVRDRTS
jgi:hypothetical protein